MNNNLSEIKKHQWGYNTSLLGVTELTVDVLPAFVLSNQIMLASNHHHRYLAVERVCQNCGKSSYIRVSFVRKTIRTKGKALALCASCSHAGSHSNTWIGGICDNGFGYLLEKCRKHPYATQAGYVLQHRLVMEQLLGRYLLPSEYVHHLNGIRTDNRPDNLELWAVPHPCGQKVQFVAKDILSVASPVRIGDIIQGCKVTGRRVNHKGYVEICIHGYSSSRPTGQIFEHRLVMEQILCRQLTKIEEVHHKDGNKQNNSPANLELWSYAHPKCGARVRDLVVS